MSRRRITKAGKRSKLEELAWTFLKRKGWKYEPFKLPYLQEKVYIPDFVKGNLIIETKGYFPAVDRRKILDVITYNPEYTVIMVFSNPEKPIRKGSKTTYAEWCDKHGITWINITTLKGELNANRI